MGILTNRVTNVDGKKLLSRGIWYLWFSFYACVPTGLTIISLVLLPIRLVFVAWLRQLAVWQSYRKLSAAVVIPGKCAGGSYIQPAALGKTG